MNPIGFQPVTEPFGNWAQENSFRQPYSQLNAADQYGPRRTFPREMPYTEWDPKKERWRRGPHVLRHFKPEYFFSRPHDGKRKGTMGRFKDAVKGEGADVFITICGDKRTRMKDRPQRWQWTGKGLTPQEMLDRRMFDRDFRECDFMMPWNTTWAAEKRAHRPFYNFRTRKFEYAGETDPGTFWMNAQWPDKARRDDMVPINVQDFRGEWWSRVPAWAGQYCGGRPRPQPRTFW